jgi:glycosyltransferase involved in cell wall biosynthesis
MLASIVIRTLNEATHLGSLLSAIETQRTTNLDTEVVVVDSGSTDGTLTIAEKYGCRIVHISRKEFSFGRSLNIGCKAAAGEILIIISGHCVPVGPNWLQALCLPLVNNLADYTYGRQIGGPSTRYSEHRIFAKYYPQVSRIPQDGFFCNNANAAIKRSTWAELQFDETLTGLEDMELAQRLVKSGGKVAYTADACVVHHHDETWKVVQRRFEREAIALQKIMPQVHIHKLDLIRYVASSIYLDMKAAISDGLLLDKAVEIVHYRVAQYLGSYTGNHLHRLLSNAQKEAYFYPAELGDRDEAQSGRTIANEGEQRARQG